MARRIADYEIARLLLADGFDPVPGVVGEIDEVIEFTCTAEPEGTIDHDAFAVDIVGLMAEEVDGKIGEFVVAAEALHGMVVFCALFEIFRGEEARESAFGGERAGGDGVEPDVMPGPFDGERAGHSEDAGFGASGGHD